ncbi:hypothetical protein OESDEN_14629 [Oesophagostomum dentatum]|uniref:DDE Tnp4 domain-containing protein n=1 Tax=Oesophagostomum dentatum TaxID=61180 RepID=A0A0B1SR56_OESDE|nr:hypothetical protein OESDEN_14629 [Oesophagostomum dentatum]
MTFNNPSDLVNIVWALELIQAMAENIKSDERTRLYVREEHRPFLYSRFRNFDSYLVTQNRRTSATIRGYCHVNSKTYSSGLARICNKSLSMPHPSVDSEDCSFTWEMIRYVGHGYGYGSLAEELNIGRQTVSDIVAEMADVINIFLFAEAFPPLTPEMMEDCAVKAQERYDYPRAAGFMDGKHVSLRKPKNSGSTYWNYKSCHSIILLAVWDCDYRFITFDTFFELHYEVFPETAMLNEVGPVQYHILVDGGFAQGIDMYAPSLNRRRRQRVNAASMPSIAGLGE